ncbi:NUDIX domain-containing protein [Chitinophaga pinensis]|uniref:NUDIX hydrolase n=1 Tax=Chitinophaga pinensis (strain ATCC 43595 / DSM 2588 / LMG 13176 / NBRC 15968 / NCIMB 11800 / UQM 2034) TaxID=485918 RepID=A0A979GST1_CHIPD|nr:NUDIX domain-containing protein [Chitinophaga pinensis]ACU63277.1 NUDIX hydrolase [Chitinophaga pinensis DSM 2588]
MAKQSAGILLYRRQAKRLEVFLGHPGGPFWAKKDQGSWSVPKGEYLEGEEPLQAAIREFEEETGYRPDGDFIQLTTIRQKGHKTVHCWAVEGDLDPDKLVSNDFEMEWPPRSGKMKSFPEIDRGAWFSVEMARKKILERQAAFIDELVQLIDE